MDVVNICYMLQINIWSLYIPSNACDNDYDVDNELMIVIGYNVNALYGKCAAHKHAMYVSFKLFKLPQSIRNIDVICGIICIDFLSLNSEILIC